MEGIKRRRLGERAWREVLARHAGGGESVSAFCRREGLSPNSFRRWHRVHRVLWARHRAKPCP